MNKEVISDKQGLNLVILFIMGSTMVIGVGGEAGKDSWLSIILAIILSFPILMIYAKILSLFPGKDLFDIIEYVFSKFIGKVISIIYIWFAFHLGALILRNFGEFIYTVSLPETPLIISIIFVTFLCAWGVKSGIEVLGKWGVLVLPVLIFLIALTILLLMPNMDINKIRPILFKGIEPVFEGAFSVFTFPFAETVIFCLVFSSLNGNKSPYKVYMYGLIIGGIIVVATALTEILVLGEMGYTTMFFPSHNTVSRISIADFIQRSEIIVSIAFLGGGFIKTSICLLGACKGVAKVFGYKDYRFIVIPVALLMMNLSYLIYDDINEMVNWAFETWRYYAVLFQVILPVIILIGALIKKKSTTY